MSRTRNTIKAILLRVKNEILIQKNGCWDWAAGEGRGYPGIHIAGKKYQLHRKMYGWFVGPIPAGAFVHHKCENPRCINPAHLEATFEHGKKHLKTHCIWGHKYTPENTRWEGHYRHCRICGNKRSREYAKNIRLKRT